MTATRSRAASREAMLRAAAGLSFAAACIHASVLVSHFIEYWLFGVFFLVTTAFQLAWAAPVWQGRDDRRLLLVGGAANAAIVAVWIVSRTAGLPFGPHAGDPEGVGIKDLAATYAEVMLVVVVAMAVAERGRRLPAWALTAAWGLASVGMVAALLDAAH